MPASKCRPFMLQHCWKILEHSEKWRLRDEEGAPKRGALNMEDGEDSDDPPRRGRNKDKPDGRKMEKDQAKREKEASLLKDQIASMMKEKEPIMAKHLEVNVALAEKKNEGKEKKWMPRCSFEERKISIEE